MELAAATRLIASWRPGAVATAVRPLVGGVSARTDLVQWLDHRGESGSVVVRRAGKGSAGEAGAMLEVQAITGEWARLQRIPIPELLYLDVAGELLGEPCFMVAHVAGAPNFGPIGVSDLVTPVASILASLHGLDGSHPAALVKTPDPRLQFQPVGTDAGDVVLEAAAALRAWDAWDDGLVRVLHGDFWPGNLLWRDGKLVAVIDWEEAALGDPLRDVALTCLDLRWLFGPSASEAFLREYAARAGSLDRRRLAYWQLWAGLRPLGQLERWSATYPALGRPDVTPRAMQAALEASLAEALGVLNAPVVHGDGAAAQRVD